MVKDNEIIIAGYKFNDFAKIYLSDERLSISSRAIKDLIKTVMQKEQECKELKNKLQRYIDKEKFEKELNEKCSVSFKEMLRMLHRKPNGNKLKGRNND